jgi:hypothetical protein
MSMHPSPIEPVPEETARIARAAFRRGNLLMRIRDEIGILYDGSPACMTLAASWRYPLGAWPWSPSFSSSRTCPTGRRPRRCAAGST